MIRKFIFISSLIIFLLIAVVLLWTNTDQGQYSGTAVDLAKIKETILTARRIRIEAEYTFDTSKFNTVYINDSRGGELSNDAVDLIRNLRNNPNIQANQVGFLDYEETAIENLKINYENYLTDLKAKQAAGELTAEEKLILDGETYGWPTAEATGNNDPALATQTCESFLSKEFPSRIPPLIYPEPETPTPESRDIYPSPGESHLNPETVSCPTLTPKSIAINVPYRGSDPSTLSADEFNIDIVSITIDDKDVATAVVQKRSVISEYTLVKVDNQWYIAGSKLISAAP